MFAAIAGLVVVGAAVAYYVSRPRPGQPSTTPTPMAQTPAAAPAPNAPPPRKERLTTAEIFAASEGAVAVVHSEYSTGSGFIVANGLLATNAHVVDEMFLDEIRIIFPSRGKREYKANHIAFFDPARDLCLIAMETPGEALPLADGATLVKGDDLVIIGSPGLTGDMVAANSPSRGVLGGETTIRGQVYLQLSASINPGNSGGPVLGPTGAVVAVATLKMMDKEGLAFGIPSTAVAAAVARVRATDSTQQQGLSDRHEALVAYERLRYAAQYLLKVFPLSRAVPDGDWAEGRGKVRDSIDRVDERIRALSSRSGVEAGVAKDLLDLHELVERLPGYLGVSSPKATTEVDEGLKRLKSLSTRLATSLGVTTDPD